MTQLSRRIALNLLDRARKRLAPPAPHQEIPEAIRNFRFSYGPPPAIKTRETVGGQIKRAAKYTFVVFGMVGAMIVGGGYLLDRPKPPPEPIHFADPPRVVPPLMSAPPSIPEPASPEQRSYYSSRKTHGSGPVHVKGYYNSHGHWVESYTRSRPHRH